MKILVNGITGRMGSILGNLIEDREDMELVFQKKLSDMGCIIPGVYTETEEEKPDVVIDFSHPSQLKTLLEFCRKENLPVVISTTGHTDEDMELIREASGVIPIFKSANMSLGVNLVSMLVREIAEKFKESDVEIIETHHNRKLDSPSGTALMLADSIKEARPDATYKMGRSGKSPREKNEIGIHAIRVGNVVGTHEVIFGTDSQSIKIVHEAHDRALFAEGALDAAEFIFGKAPGIYNMEDLIRDMKEQA